MIHGQTSTKYANLGFFRHPCPPYNGLAFDFLRTPDKYDRGSPPQNMVINSCYFGDSTTT